MSELIQRFKGDKLTEWEQWYLSEHPEAIQKATKKILQMIDNFKQVVHLIDEEMVRKWVKDLVIVKTFVGLKFQEAILKRVSEYLGKEYRIADPNKEAEGIDGYIGEIPVSIKPKSYNAKTMLPEAIPCTIISYEKVKDGINVFFEESQG